MENNEGTGWEKDKSQRKKTVGKKKLVIIFSVNIRKIEFNFHKLILESIKKY